MAIAWVDFRSYNWDVLLARSTDGGASFGPAARADDGTEQRERIHDDPALAFAPDGALVCGWSDVRLRKSPAKARVAREAQAALGASQILGAAPDDTSAWRPRLASTDAGAVVAVWQDFRARSGDIYLAVSADLGASFGPERRIDDGGDGPSHQFAPAVSASARGRIIVAWEDTRSGRRRIRFVSGEP